MVRVNDMSEKRRVRSCGLHTNAHNARHPEGYYPTRSPSAQREEGEAKTRTFRRTDLEQEAP